MGKVFCLLPNIKLLNFEQISAKDAPMHLLLKNKSLTVFEPKKFWIQVKRVR